MRVNENIMIVDKEIVLVPYREEHVAKYHEWMSSPELQELTASEPLTIQEEYEMQRKWQHDEDKLTFIICARPSPAGGPHADQPEFTHSSLTMIGDVNLFLNGSPDDPEGEYEVEVEIMIAESAYRRRGYAQRALHLMLAYATSTNWSSRLPVPRDRLVARIGEKNEPSIRLFEKMGFIVTKKITVFEEVEMRLPPEVAVCQHWVAGDVRPFIL
ncbi:hypothetical protein NM688_g7022 [Phlebia brevispora]|uniref:Uncharacterized protein n=1 Tax=Phlebia brevispora TaxID=194682 RepID=A0ACC1SAB4_9APHY|nr:hypothetical protein NM688_g7022 [Phlebia brevispora]